MPSRYIFQQWTRWIGQSIVWLLFAGLIQWSLESWEAVYSLIPHTGIRIFLSMGTWALTCLFVMAILYVGLTALRIEALWIALTILCIRILITLVWRQDWSKLYHQYAIFVAVPILSYTLGPAFISKLPPRHEAANENMAKYLYTLSLLAAAGWIFLHRMWTQKPHAVNLVTVGTDIAFLVVGVLLFVTLFHMFPNSQKRIPYVVSEIIIVLFLLISAVTQAVRRAAFRVSTVNCVENTKKRCLALCTWLRKINAVEERFLLQTKSKKLVSGRRPLLTPAAVLEKANDATFEWIQLNNDVIGSIEIKRTKDVNVVTITFRGTNQVSEWVGNLLGAMHLYSVHDGTTKHVEMNEVAHRACDQIVSFLKPHRDVKRFVITGHSRGATLSVYVALLLMRQFREQMHLILFAPPPLVTIQSYLSFLKSSNAQSRIETVVLNNDPFNFSAFLHPSLTSFCPIDAQSERVTNTVIQLPHDVPNRKQKFFQPPNDKKDVLDSSMFTKTKLYNAAHRPMITHDLVEYVRALNC